MDGALDAPHEPLGLALAYLAGSFFKTCILPLTPIKTRERLESHATKAELGQDHDIDGHVNSVYE